MKKKAAKKKTTAPKRSSDNEQRDFDFSKDVPLIDSKQALQQHARDLARFIDEEIPILGFNVRRLFNDDSALDEARERFRFKLNFLTFWAPKLFDKQLSATKKLWLFGKQRSAADPTDYIVNAEFELRQFLDELLNIHAKPQTRPKRGRPKDDRVKERQRIVASNPSTKPGALQDLIEQQTGIRPTINEVRNDKKRIGKRRK